MVEKPNNYHNQDLSGKTILITGGARRIGRALSLSVARAGARVIIHHGHSPREATETRDEIEAKGGEAFILEADFNNTNQVLDLVPKAWRISPLFGVVNNAAIFETLLAANTSLADWERHLKINLTAPFLISRSFSQLLGPGEEGRIINILDWRALRPGVDHFPYTISKAALASLTRSLAVAFAPHITVNGLALGAILPPSDGASDSRILDTIPSDRWGELKEVESAVLFLLSGPSYITGEIIHVDGGRHLV